MKKIQKKHMYVLDILDIHLHLLLKKNDLDDKEYKNPTFYKSLAHNNKYIVIRTKIKYK